MIVQGEIIQIIKWEKRNDFFGIDGDVKDVGIPHDLIVISNKTNSFKSRWKAYWDSWKSHKPFSFEESTLSHGVIFWVARPHDYQEFDVVEVDISFRKLASLNSNSVKIGDESE